MAGNAGSPKTSLNLPDPTGDSHERRDTFAVLFQLPELSGQGNDKQVSDLVGAAALAVNGVRAND
jgi:hypothetical protein